MNAVAYTGDYNSLSNRPNLAAVATTGNYNDLSNKPYIPSGSQFYGIIGIEQIPLNYSSWVAPYNCYAYSYENNRTSPVAFYVDNIKISGYAMDSGGTDQKPYITPTVPVRAGQTIRTDSSIIVSIIRVG